SCSAQDLVRMAESGRGRCWPHLGGRSRRGGEWSRLRNGLGFVCSRRTDRPFFTRKHRQGIWQSGPQGGTALGRCLRRICDRCESLYWRFLWPRGDSPRIRYWRGQRDCHRRSSARLQKGTATRHVEALSAVRVTRRASLSISQWWWVVGVRIVLASCRGTGG